MSDKKKNNQSFDSKRFLKKNWLYILLGIAVLGGGYYLYNRMNRLPQYNKLNPTPVTAMKVEKRFLIRKESLAGRLEADESVALTPGQQGTIKKIMVKEGQLVKKGTVLAELDNSKELALVTTQKAGVAKAKASLERAKALAAQDDIPKATVMDKEAEYQSALGQLQQAQASLDGTYITAPFDGILGIRLVSTGEFVQPNTEIVRLTRLDPLRVKFSISADRLPYVVEGNNVSLFIGDEVLPVQAIIAAKDSHLHESTHLIDVVATLENKNQNYLPGQYARVNLTTSKEEEVKAVPESSLVREDDDKIFAFVIKQDIANKVNLELGPRYGDGFIEVISGVEEGDEIIYNVGDAQQLRIHDGMPVKVVSDDTPDLREPLADKKI